MAGPIGSWHRIDAVDAAWAIRCNRLARVRALRGVFALASRLGDGVAWYALMVLLPALHGTAALPTVTRMAAAGLLGLALYKWLKARTLRPRPYQVHAAIAVAATPLDRFSFPSGHTLHAVSFATVASAGYPELAAPTYAFAALVAASRPILGLHYPGDVIAGALLGAAVAHTVLAF